MSTEWPGPATAFDGTVPFERCAWCEKSQPSCVACVECLRLFCTEACHRAFLRDEAHELERRSLLRGILERDERRRVQRWHLHAKSGRRLKRHVEG